MSTDWKWLNDIEEEIKILDKKLEILKETEKVLKNLKEMNENEQRDLMKYTTE